MRNLSIGQKLPQLVPGDHWKKTCLLAVWDGKPYCRLRRLDRCPRETSKSQEAPKEAHT